MRTGISSYETWVQDIRDLRAFALACDLKSLTSAAQRMGESKTTTSRRITRLETALGTALLRRSPRAIETTDEGAAYRVHVAHVLELLADANAAAHGGRGVPSGQLRVTAPPGLDDTLAPVLAQFSATFPRVAMSIHVGARHVDMQAEQFDVAIRLKKEPADSKLIAHRVGTVAFERVVVAAASYLEARPAPRRVEELAAHRILSAQTDDAVQLSVAFNVRGSDAPVIVGLPVVMTSTDIALVRDMAVAGAGVAILPRLLVEPYLADRRLVRLLPGVDAPGPDLYLLHRAVRFVPPKVRAFVDFMQMHLVRPPLHAGLLMRP